MPKKRHHRGFSREEILEEHDDATGVDPEQDKRTLPIADGPTDHGRRVDDHEPDAYAPPSEEPGA